MVEARNRSAFQKNRIFEAEIMETLLKALGYLLKALGYVVLSVLSIVYTLFVLSNIYVLALMPLGAPQVSYPQMYGITLFLAAATHSSLYKYLEEKFIVRILSHAMGISLVWLIAYLVL